MFCVLHALLPHALAKSIPCAEGWHAVANSHSMTAPPGIAGIWRIPTFVPVQNILDGFEILLVEDNADTLELFSFVLEGHGASVRSASSAREAYASVHSHPPDIIVGDIAMPEEDGYAFLRRIREVCPDLPAIAVSGHCSRADVARALDAGYECHFAKPVDPEDLASAVFRYAKRRPR
jgi:CheY-like chemotaxis protein